MIKNLLEEGVYHAGMVFLKFCFTGFWYVYVDIWNGSGASLIGSYSLTRFHLSNEKKAWLLWVHTG